MKDQTHSVAAPALQIPTAADYAAARRAFTSELKALMRDLGYSDRAEFIEKIAMVQDPPREHCPYSADIVNDWLTGELAPTSTVMNALQSLCGDTYEQQYEALEDAWCIISQEPADLQYRYSNSLLASLEKKHEQLAQDIAISGEEISVVSAKVMLTGRTAVTSEFVHGLKLVLQSYGLEEDAVTQIERDYKALQNLAIHEEGLFNHSELTRTLLRATERMGLSVKELTPALAEHGYQNNNGGPFSKENILLAISGKKKALPYSFARAMDEVAAERGVEIEPSCCALFDQQLRETAQMQWQQGIETKSLGTLLKAISNRMGWDNHRVAEALDVTHVAVKYWQDDKTIPSDKQWYGIARFEDYCHMVERWERTAGTPAQASIQAGEEPWFDAAKRQQLHESFKHAIAERSASNNTLTLPETEGSSTKVKLFFAKVDSTQLGTSLPMSRLPTMKTIEGYRLTGKSSIAI